MKLSLGLATVAALAITSGGAAFLTGCSSSSGPGTGATGSNAPGTGDNSTGDDATTGASSGTGSTGTGAGDGDGRPADAGNAPTNEAGLVLALDGGVAEDIDPTAADFDCIHGSEWTTVGISQYKNLLGHTAEMLAVARSDAGGTFPVGTVVQLVPTEASVKRGAGYSTASHDWEFFSLGATASGTTIGNHGGDATVLNAFGLSCLNCHGKAAPQWDLICGNDVDGGNTHGCDSLPIAGSLLAESSDPRCP